ncbi:TetR/AcrR family transcriptional regulator [Anaerosporobacter faecicola]|uniref:TetR/AcrR family transcriptional regulator n=1 Tax=Anaerosporobacter faecicola TaxID=2718714 RepID=UPI00143954EF|nr:TetR/AcrR family transcriptional regulator [Anaerosporobacter faecicola]
MPPKQKITKDMILEAARALVRREGIERINSRNVAKELECSTQPIFSQFPTMEQLRQGVHDYCCSMFEQEVLADKEQQDFMKMSYLKVIHLAREEKNLFRLVYLSEYCGGHEFLQIRMNYESNNRILKQIMGQYQLEELDAMDILQRSSLLIQGIATLIATTNCEYTDEEVCRLVEQTILDMVDGKKKK